MLHFRPFVDVYLLQIKSHTHIHFFGREKMSNSLQKSEQLAKKCEQLPQVVSKFNKTIEDTISAATNDMNSPLNSIKQKYRRDGVRDRQ